jgi:hypothetical protein
VARFRMKPMCVVAARISSMRHAHWFALSLVFSNGNPAIVGSWFPRSWKRGQVRSEIEHPQVAHREARELRQLAQLDRQPFELIAVDLSTQLSKITIHSIRISH